ncbi:hypothetical protein JCM8097_006933 [Rhodosporidiobolus ruineniae]
MASQPFFALAPGDGPRSTSNSSPALHSPYFQGHDTYSPLGNDPYSASPEHHRGGFASHPPPPPVGSGPSHTSFGTVGTARPYPQLERRSFRDASVAADVLVNRDDGGFGSAPTSAGLGSIPLARKPSTGGPAGAIGEGRRVTPSPQPSLREEEKALGLPSGIFDGHGALFPSSAGGEDGRAASENGKSRPSSFILDVLPQTRERGSAGPSTPSLSLDSSSQPPSTSTTEFQPLPSPHSLAPVAPTSLLNTSSSASTTSLPLSPNGNVLSASRTSSPGPLESSSSSAPSVESLAVKVNTLESTVSGLSNLLASEFRNLREEVGLLRSLVLQNNSNGTARQAFERQQERETDSPVLTLRSPSPRQQQQQQQQLGGFPQSIPLARTTSFGAASAASSLVAHPATSPGPVSPLAHSVPGSAGSFFGLQQLHQEAERLRSTSDDSAASSSFKDEQIKLLTAQVSSLSTTVSQLLANPNVAAAAGVNPALAAAATASAAPSPHLGNGGAGPASAPSMSRNMSLPLASPALGQPTGLGVSTPAGMLSPSLGSVSGMSAQAALASSVGGPGGVRSPLMRPVSTPGLARSASMRSATGADEGQPPQGQWGAAMASPMLGGPPSAVQSPMLGNPPGSLGSKWEVLGVGQDLFRAIAKYGLGPPTKIQGKAIPCVVRGQDVVAQAPAIQERIQCYVIPVLQILYTHASLAAQQAALEGTQRAAPGVQAVVVTATVDQAAQAQRLAVGLGGALGLRTSLCVGSSNDIQSELQTLVKAPPNILVGTPQKLLDLFALRQLPMADIRLLIVDECDQLIARNLSELVLNLARLFPATVTVPGGPAASSSPVMARSPLPGAFDSPSFAPMARFGSNQGTPGGVNGSNGVNSSVVVGNLAGGTLDRQMAVFSCTVPQDVLTFATQLQLKEPVKVLVRRDNNAESSGGPGAGDGGPRVSGGPSAGGGGGGGSNPFRSVKQYYLYLAMGGNPGSKSKTIGAGRREAGPAREWKLEALADLVEDATGECVVVFAASLEGVEAVTYKLGMRGIEALALHQDMGQSARQQVLVKFRSSASPPRPGFSSFKRVLVVLDSLSRGLATEVAPVPLVINFDMPRAADEYGPRIACAQIPHGQPGGGRGSQNMVINIVTPNEAEMIRAIESFYRCKINELPPNFASN